MTYYIDSGTSKGCAVARTWRGEIISIAMYSGWHCLKSWGEGNWTPEPTFWEKPQLYPNELKNSRPAVVVAKANDLIELAAAGADTARALAGPYLVTAKRPREWKGQVPKPIQHARVIGRLNAAELALLERAYGKKDPTALANYIRTAAVRVGKTGVLTGYQAEITDILDAVAFALVIEGRL